MHFLRYKEFSRFLLNPDNAVLVISRDADYLDELITKSNKMIKNNYAQTLFVFDEVHGFGSSSIRNTLSGKVQPFRYRLGLSATPEREFDEEGNIFIQKEIGKIIFIFTLKDAIEKGILCMFDYIPLEYELTDEEKRKKRDIIARYSAKRNNNESFSEDEMYRELAFINKTSEAKLPLFEDLISRRPELLERSIIFVQTKEYGIRVQNILINYFHEYHTYYGEDDSDNLLKFSRRELDCLLTCQKISEGIDIHSVKNIFLFASDRAKLVTTQRIGRSLRIDPKDQDKRSCVIDYICVNPYAEPDATEISADEERCQWLTDLSHIRRLEDNESI
jgi:superfamily II DNA or RNA helicase